MLVNRSKSTRIKRNLALLALCYQYDIYVSAVNSLIFLSYINKCMKYDTITPIEVLLMLHADVTFGMNY